jgi:hypothetical protein
MLGSPIGNQQRCGQRDAPTHHDPKTTFYDCGTNQHNGIILRSAESERDTNIQSPAASAIRLLPKRGSSNNPFTSGDHAVFSGRGRLRCGARDAEFQRLTYESSLAFWDADLRGDARAKDWLTTKFKDAPGKAGVLALKLKK